MIIAEEQEKLFVIIGKELKRKIIAYAIGGTAMILQGDKESTLDIDLVFLTEKDREDFKKAALNSEWKEFDAKIVYGIRKYAPLVIKSEKARLDLFLREVIIFSFSKKMQERAMQTHEFGRNLIVKAADAHDIILMKCATDREKDKEDVTAILKNKRIDWKIIIEEIKNQVSLGKETAILELGRFLEELRNLYKIDIPKSVLDELWLLLKKQAEDKIEKSKK